MNFPFTKILKQAYEIVRSNKFFWIFGLFLISGNFSYLFLSLAIPTPSNDQAISELNLWFVQNPSEALFVEAVFVVFVLILAVLNFRSKAATIVSTKGILDKQDVNFRKSLSISKKYYLRIFGASIFLGILLLMLSAVLVTPVMYLYLSDFGTRAANLGALAFAILVPTVLLLTYLNIFSALFIALYDRSVFESIRVSFNLVAKKMPQIIIFSMLLWVRVFLAFLAVFFMVFLSMLAFTFAYETSLSSGNVSWASVIFGVGVFVSGLIFLFGSAIIFAFHQVSWTLAFMELVKPVKFEEPEVAPAPEAV